METIQPNIQSITVMVFKVYAVLLLHREMEQFISQELWSADSPESRPECG